MVLAALWPLFHYLLWQDGPSSSSHSSSPNPKLTDSSCRVAVASEYPLEDPNFRPYYEANKAFAERVAAVHKPGDLIFVHDCALFSSSSGPPLVVGD